MKQRTSVFFLVLLGFFIAGKVLAATIITTNTSDTLDTFRTNVNTSLTNLNAAIPAGTTVSSVQQTYGTAQSGALTFATSSTATTGLTLGLNITNSSGAFTFAPSLSGALINTNGGTGLTAITDGQLIYGGTGTSMVALATSTGGLLTNSYTTGRPSWIATSTLNLSVATGGTGTTTFINGGVLFSDGSKITQSAAAANFFWDETNKKLGIGTSTPFAQLSVNSAAGTVPFAVGSSTATQFAVTDYGAVQVTAKQPATSTAMTLDWSKTGQQIEYQIGTSATTITLINATTSPYWGTTKRVWVCNPASGTAGTITWAGVEWIGTAPSQSTTANLCDLYTFNITRATSTSAYKVAGGGNTGFN